METILYITILVVIILSVVFKVMKTNTNLIPKTTGNLTQPVTPYKKYAPSITPEERLLTLKEQYENAKSTVERSNYLVTALKLARDIELSSLPPDLQDFVIDLQLESRRKGVIR